MDELRFVNLAVWGAMLLYMSRGAVAAVTRHARYGDPMRLACALTAFVIIGFNVFWLWGADDHTSDTLESDLTLNALLVLSAAVGAYILKLGATYGRGVLLMKREERDV